MPTSDVAFALTPPAELSWAVWHSDFRHDPRFAPLFASPWSLAPLGSAGGYNLAAWAYWVLLALGVLSFAINRPAVRSWRFAVWLPFALLAAWQVRLIPFFAVVAGPVAALNYRERVATAFQRAGRGVVLFSPAGALALGWAGWAIGVHTRDRGPAWAVYADPTLVRVAEGRCWWLLGAVSARRRERAEAAAVAGRTAPERRCPADRPVSP